MQVVLSLVCKLGDKTGGSTPIDDLGEVMLQVRTWTVGDGRRQAEHECQADQPGGTTAWCLTRMMDCRKPSGAFKDNVQPSLVAPGQRLVQTCTNDGYTRIDVQCGCTDCYC